MTWRLHVARLLYVCGSIPLVIFAIIYLTRQEFMPYHAVTVGREWSAVEPGIRTLVLALMRVVGGAWLASAVAILVLVAIPLRRGETWAILVTPVIGLIVGLSTLLTTLWVRANSLAEPPVLIAGLCAGTFFLGLVLSPRNGPEASPQNR